MTPDDADNFEPTTQTEEHGIEPPPIFGTWPRLYTLVLALLVADILVFWFVTKVFS